MKFNTLMGILWGVFAMEKRFLRAWVDTAQITTAQKRHGFHIERILENALAKGIPPKMHSQPENANREDSVPPSSQHAPDTPN